MKKILKNENGSILLIVVLVGAFVAGIIGVMLSNIGTLGNLTARLTIENENNRVGEELAKQVAQAYENGLIYSSGGTCNTSLGYSTQFRTFAGLNFCFIGSVTAGLDSSHCVDSNLGNKSAHICLDLATVTVADNGNGPIYQFDANWTPSKSQHHFAFETLISSAKAINAMPPQPVGLTNTTTSINCTADRAPASPCRACGSPNHVCFEIHYCPVDDPNANNNGCGAAREVRLGVMIVK